MKTKKKNPYDMIKDMTLTSIKNPSLKLILTPSKLLDCGKRGIIMDKYSLNIPDCKYSEDQISEFDMLLKLKRFCKLAKNKYSAMHMFLRAYFANKEKFSISINAVPSKVTNKDKDYIEDNLF